MILPSQPPSSYNGENQALPPPSYQDSVPSSQLLPSEHLTASLYAPSVSSRPSPSHEGDHTPRLDSRGEKDLSIGFPEPRTPTGRTHSQPPFPLPKDREKEGVRDGPAQRAFGMFSSMVWGTTSTASTSRSPNQANHALATQDPLNPAPSAFTRPTPKNYAYLPFQPMTMLGIGSNLADGFPAIPPPTNPEDERQVGKANPQHPFVSHDVTEEDWFNFLTGLKTVSSSSSQTQKSFLARMFLSEMNERDQRKRAIHFIDSWNHYFFQPRRMTVVLARGRRIFSGASGNHVHRRHSTSYDRGRDPIQTRGHRHRSYSTDSSSSSSSSSSSDSSIHSTTSEPHEMPVPHTQTNHDPHRGGGGSIPGMGRGGGWRGGGYPGPIHPEWHGGRGGRGRYSPGAPGAPGPGGGGPLAHVGPWQFHSYRDHKQAWKSEKRTWKVEGRAIKHEHRRIKRAMRHEKRQRRLEAKATRYGGKGIHKGDQPWKLIISFHGARRDCGQS